jgi:hypothetical protein
MSRLYFDPILNMPRKRKTDPAAAAWIALEEAAGYTFTAGERAGTNTAFTRMRSQGLLSKVFRLQLFCMGTSARNAICPIGTTTLVGGITHNSKSATANGTTGYVNTGFIPSSGGWTKDSIAYGYYLKTDVGGSVSAFGVNNGANQTIWGCTRTGGVSFADFNTATGATTERVIGTASGAAGLRTYWKNGANGAITNYNGSRTTIASNSGLTNVNGALPTIAFFFWAYNNAGSPIGYIAEEHSLQWIAGGLTSQETIDLELILYDWLTAFSVTPLLTLNDVPEFRVFQRESGTAEVPVTGSYVGTIGAVEARILDADDDSTVVDWTTIVASPSGGTFSGTLTVPEGGPYRQEIRLVADTSQTKRGNSFLGVGDVIVGYGQSNMTGMFFYASSPPAASAGTGYFDGTNWVTVPAFNGVREFANAYKAATGVPVALMDCSVVGESLEYMSPGGAGYTAMLAKLAAGGNKARMFLWVQGEFESDPGSTVTGAQYKTNFATMHQAAADYLGKTREQVPFLIGSLGRATSGFSDAGWQKMQEALYQLDSQDGVYFSHSNTDAALIDYVHLNAASQGRQGKRFAQTAKIPLGLSAFPAHFDITGASTINGTTTNVTVAHSHGTDITVGPDGWEVSGDSGGSWIAATPTRVNATTIQLAHSSIATGSTRRVRYLYGRLASGVPNGVVDNSSLALPLTYSNGAITPS